MRGLDAVVARGRVLVLVIVGACAGGGPGEGVSQHPLASNLFSSPALLDPNISLKQIEIVNKSTLFDLCNV